VGGGWGCGGWGRVEVEWGGCGGVGVGGRGGGGVGGMLVGKGGCAFVEG